MVNANETEVNDDVEIASESQAVEQIPNQSNEAEKIENPSLEGEIIRLNKLLDDKTDELKALWEERTLLFEELSAERANQAELRTHTEARIQRLEAQVS